MKAKTKTVEVDGQRYLIRRLPANVGSFILARVSAASAGSATVFETGAQDMGSVVMMFASFLRALSFDDFTFIQNHCLAVVARLEIAVPGAPEAPMPIVTDSGVFAIPEISEDLPLVMSLTIQSLLFNLSDFFDLSALSAAIGSPVSKSSATQV